LKNGHKLKLGDAGDTPRNIQEVQASKLGDAQGIPFFINKATGHFSMHYILIPSYDMCYSWSVFVFAFSFVWLCYVLFTGINKLDPINLVLERTHSVLIALNTLVFTISFN
jgi:hypothetical protein